MSRIFPWSIAALVALVGPTGCTSDDGTGDGPSSTGSSFSTSETTSETVASMTTGTGDPTTSSSSETTQTSDPTAGGPRCGDGILDPDEACDDGNISSADGCLADCTPASCGDGVLWVGAEECDAGEDNDDKSPSGCRLDCRAPACGDGAIYPATFGPPIELATTGQHTDAKLSETAPRAVAMDGSGRVLVVTDWTLLGGIIHQAVVERYTPGGELFGPPIIAFETGGGIHRPAIAAAADGSFIVAWENGGDNNDVLFRRYDADGTALEDPTVISEDPSGQQRHPMAAMNDAGEAVITFRSTGGLDPGNYNVIRARKLPPGDLGAPDFVVSALETDVSSPSAAIRSDGSFVVGYAERDLGTVYVTNFDPAGAALLQLAGVPGLISAADGNFHWIGVAAPDNGDFAVAGMTDTSNLGVHRYDASGTLLHQVIASEPLGSIPRIDLRADPQGNLIALWGGCGIPGESSNCKGDPSTLGLRRIYADGQPYAQPLELAQLPAWDRQGIGLAINASGRMAVVAEQSKIPYLRIADIDCP